MDSPARIIQNVTDGLNIDTRSRLSRTLDATFFWFGTLTAIWLLWVLTGETFSYGLHRLWFLLPMYVLLAYLILPRLHTGISRIYLPDYFIGRTRTREGILGDPINVAFVGDEAQLHAAMRAAGWTAADPITLKSTWRIITSTITRKSYIEAPVSDLYVFGKRQDFAYQREVDGNPAQRHHIRFWESPQGWMLPGGHNVDWVAAGTYDRKVGFSLFTLQVTHKIERNTDIERDFIVNSIETASTDVRTTVIADFSTGYHARNGGGDNIETDGDLPIVDLRAVAPTVADHRESASLIRAVRPIGTMVGSLLILLRSAAWIYNFCGLLSRPSNDVMAVLLLILLASIIVLPLVLSFSIWRGRNWSRVLVMLLSSMTIVAAILTYFTTTGAPVEGGLITVVLDIGVLLSLSGGDARRFTLEVRAARHLARLG